MNDRETILARIREALADRPQLEAPPVPGVWPETHPDRETMIRRFAEELDVVQGELHRCGSMDDARAKLAELVDEPDCDRLGVVDRPLTRELAEGLPAARVAWVDADWDGPAIAGLKASLVTSDLLLADTGSCLVECPTAAERMMCYLPPVCIVATRVEALREHLPAAWREVAPRVSNPKQRGELVFITGPSRTADIEKILILGVHGPKRLIVLAVE